MKINIRDYLTSQGGPSVELPAIVDFDDLFAFAGVDDEMDADVHALLADERQIAIIWSVEDVQAVRPDLDDDQAWTVLQDARRRHDADIGINWQTLTCSAEMLFGPAAADEA